MPATTPEQIHRSFENRFNAGDLDHLMELYGSDAALIAQPGSVAQGSEQVGAALQGFLALKGRITLETKLVVTGGDLAYLSNTWSLRGPGRTASQLLWAPRRPRWRGARPTATGAM
jgi:ketosteroid isomerase-like protein